MNARTERGCAEAIPGRDAQWEADVIRALGPERGRDALAAVASLPALTPEDAAAIGVLFGPIEPGGQDMDAA